MRRKRDDICQGRKGLALKRKNKKSQKRKEEEDGVQARTANILFRVYLYRTEIQAFRERIATVGAVCRGAFFTAALHALFSSYFTQTREADQISSSDGSKWIPD